MHLRKSPGQGGLPAPENTLTLCGSGTAGCYGWVHANIAESQDSGWLVRSTEDPAMVPVLVAGGNGGWITVWLNDSGTYSFEEPP